MLGLGLGVFLNWGKGADFKKLGWGREGQNIRKMGGEEKTSVWG